MATLQQRMEDFDKNDTDPALLARMKAFDQSEKPETIESKYLDPYVYPALGVAAKTAGVVGKLTGVPEIAATAYETATGGPKAGYEALKGELSQWQPTEKSSMAHQFNKIPGMNQPIMDTSQEEATGKPSPITNAFLGGSPETKIAARKWLQGQFPELYNAASKVTYGDVAGGAGDVLAGEALAPYTTAPVQKAALEVGHPLMGSAINNTEKAIERMSALSGENASEASNMMKTRKAAITAMKYGLTDDLTNPPELVKKLNGEYDILPDELKGMRIEKTKQGLVDKLTKDANGLASDVSKSSEPIDVKRIGNEVFNDMSSTLSDPNSGATWDEGIASGLKKRINNFFKSTPHDLNDAADMMKAGDPERAMEMQKQYNEMNNRDFQSIVKLKRAAADKIYEINKNPDIYGVEGPTDKAMFKSIWDKLDDRINKVAIGGDESAQQFVEKNSELSDMLHLKNMTQNARVTGLKTLSIPEMAAGAVGGAAVGSMVGQPALGALAYPATKTAGKIGETNIPAYLAPKLQNAAGFAHDTATGANQMAKIPARSAAVGMSLSNPMHKINLPMQLVSYQIPRDSNEILKNKDIVLAKIAQMSGDDPNHIVDTFKDALENHPDKLPKVLPALVLKFPDLFENDDYNRVDSRIFDPQMKQKALKDIENDRNMNIREKAFKSKRLQTEGLYDR